jgi:hypothetical protein
MTIMFTAPIKNKCNMLRSISATKPDGDIAAIPIQVKCLGESVGYDTLVDNALQE